MKGRWGDGLVDGGLEHALGGFHFAAVLVGLADGDAQLEELVRGAVELGVDALLDGVEHGHVGGLGLGDWRWGRRCGSGPARRCSVRWRVAPVARFGALPQRHAQAVPSASTMALAAPTASVLRAMNFFSR